MVQTDASSSERPKSVEKTEAILEGAMQEFLAHGYAATSMDRVAATAGVSKATVYSYFGDKEGLFAALIRRLAEKKFRAMFHLQDSEVLQGKPSDVLRRLATTMLDNATSDRQLQAFMRTIVGESGRFPELAQPYLENVAKPALDTLTRYLASRPELELPDPEATARIFMGSLVYFVILQEVLQGREVMPMERDRLVDSLIYLIVGSKE